jgi:citrate lyase subunit beta / citryl-CoA lyase
MANATATDAQSGDDSRPEQGDPRSLWGAHLFVPANRAGFLTRLPIVRARNLIIDLEYATKLPFKTDGRYLARGAIGYLRSVRPDFFITIRCNVPATGALMEEDLRIIVAARPDAIRVPSVNHPDEIKRIDALLGELERAHGLAEGSIDLHPMIETPAGLRHAHGIATASPRNRSLCLGGEDWAHNLGLARTRSGKELEYVKASLVGIACEHGLLPIDSVYNWLDDLDGLRADTELSATLGFRARATTNPRQVAVIEEAYQPAADNVKWAMGLLASLETVEIAGERHFVSNGIITDPLAVQQARALIRFVEREGSRARAR